MTTPGPSIPTYAIILTHNRPELLDRCVRAIAPQVNRVVVVDNASDPPAAPPIVEDETGAQTALWVISEPEQPPNLSKLWNQAFDLIVEWQSPVEQWNLIVLCDDADVPAGWVTPLVTAMREHKAAAAYTKPSAHLALKVQPDRDIWNRLPGWAFALAGEKGLRADERLRWWWCDTHLDWLARAAGGMLVVPGPWVANSRDNEYTNAKPELMEQAGRDGETFAQIWGWRPW